MPKAKEWIERECDISKSSLGKVQVPDEHRDHAWRGSVIEKDIGVVQAGTHFHL